MCESEDELKLIGKDDKSKHAAKVSDHDKAALLSSGEEEDDQFTGEMMNAIDFEEGSSLSGSDDEVTAYTGNLETYIGDDTVGVHTESNVGKVTKNVKEGTLIKINDEDVGDNNLQIQDDEDIHIEILPTNNSISEIANKLEEVKVSNGIVNHGNPGKPVLIRGNSEYLENMGFKESGSSCGEKSVENGGGYSSSGETSQPFRNENVRKERKKKLRKRNITTEKEENIKNTEIIKLNSNGDIHNSNEDISKLDPYNISKVNGHMENGPSQVQRSSSRSISSISHEDEELSDYKRKHIHTESTPDSKVIKTNTDSDRSNMSDRSNKSNRSNKSDRFNKNIKINKSLNKRSTRTRHKIYLDDPDVHNLINEHVVLLKRFVDNADSEKTVKGLDHEQTQSLPNISFVGVSQVNNTSTYSVGPYGHHKSRGKDLVSRIRNDAIPPFDSDLDEDGYPNGKDMDGLNNQQLSHTYDICPDCGERHPPDELIDEAEICPDCGVQHNPYQHTPSAQDPEDNTQDTLPSTDGPHTLEELTDGIRYKLKYLGSSQIVSQHPITKETRMQQAQDAFNRIKGQDDDDDDDTGTNIEMAISLERIRILNQETKFEDVMMDHALRTVCFICDMGNILVLMARRLTSDHSTDFSLEKGQPISLGNIVGDREKKTSKNICHVFETEEACKIAKAIGQAFNIAYRNFLQSNGISHEHVEEAEYCHVLESQKLVGADLDRLTDQSASKEVNLNKKAGESLGIMLLESGWGSMLPTVFVAHIANYSVAARCQQLTVGDHVLSCNGSSLVGIPLSECNIILKNSRSSNRVVLRVVSCPPVVDVVISRPDVKYQLGFSVQNGTICSLLRGGIAERGGVRVGHRIIEINGDSVVAKTHQYIVDLLANTIGSIGMKTMPIAMYRLMVGDDQPQHI